MPPLLEFDPDALGEILRVERARRGWSSRDLAGRAGISQSYVLTLELATGRPTAAVPTVQVLARLAAALDLDATHVFRQVMRPVARHVLLVTPPGTEPEAAARAAVRASGGPSVTWLTAASDPSRRGDVDLRPEPDAPYVRERIHQRLVAELTRQWPAIAETSVGLLFAETSKVIADGTDASEVLEFEREWAGVVDDACRRTRTRALWNVCVYDTGVVAALADPLAAASHLLTAHDDVWFAAPRGPVAGLDAARRFLEAVRPTHRPRSDWAASTAPVLAGARHLRPSPPGRRSQHRRAPAPA